MKLIKLRSKWKKKKKDIKNKKKKIEKLYKF